MTWRTVARGSSSVEQKTSADDMRREKITSIGTPGTKSWHWMKDRPKMQTKEKHTKAVV